MLGVHLVGVAERMIRGVDDDVRMVVGIGSAVDADETAAAVGIARPAGLWRRAAPGHDADPRLVAQAGAVLADKDRLRQAVGNMRRADAGVAVERAVDER